MKMIVERDDENQSPSKDNRSFLDMLGNLSSSKISSKISIEDIMKMKAINRIDEDFSSLRR